jgi:Fic family protein
MGNLLYQYSLCHRDPVINPLILDAVFILDFLCIHPFNDGNGRVSRLLTTFLLLKDGYPVDLYDSVSYRILQHREEYYQALSSSDQGWEKGKNDPSSFVLFFLRMILESYQKLDERIELFKEKATAAEKVRKVILASEIPVSKADIEETLFFYSRTTIEKALGDLLKAKEIQMVQSGHYAKYYRP